MNYQYLKKIIQEVNDRHWIAFHHPRLKKISINGHRPVSEVEGLKRMLEMLNNDKEGDKK